MGTFGGSIWNGGGSGGGGTLGTPLSDLIMPAYRIAGITQRAMIVPSPDMYAEAIPEYNRMLGQWNCARPKIFTIRIDAFPIVAGQKAFTIGPGGEFDMPRPQAIQNGVIIMGPGATGEVRMPPMHQMDDAEWARIRLQDIANGIPLSFYYDGSYDVNGLGTVYLWPQTGNSYQVEWYTWQAIPALVATTDLVALPPGYESAIVLNLAVRLAMLNPHQSNMDPRVPAQANQALAAIESHNAPTPHMVPDFEPTRPRHWDWRIGQMR